MSILTPFTPSMLLGTCYVFIQSKLLGSLTITNWKQHISYLITYSVGLIAVSGIAFFVLSRVFTMYSGVIFLGLGFIVADGLLIWNARDALQDFMLSQPASYTGPCSLLYFIEMKRQKFAYSYILSLPARDNTTEDFNIDEQQFQLLGGSVDMAKPKEAFPAPHHVSLTYLPHLKHIFELNVAPPNDLSRV